MLEVLETVAKALAPGRVERDKGDRIAVLMDGSVLDFEDRADDVHNSLIFVVDNKVRLDEGVTTPAEDSLMGSA